MQIKIGTILKGEHFTLVVVELVVFYNGEVNITVADSEGCRHSWTKEELLKTINGDIHQVIPPDKYTPAEKLWLEEIAKERPEGWGDLAHPPVMTPEELAKITVETQPMTLMTKTFYQDMGVEMPPGLQEGTEKTGGVNTNEMTPRPPKPAPMATRESGGTMTDGLALSLLVGSKPFGEEENWLWDRVEAKDTCECGACKLCAYLHLQKRLGI